MKKTKKLLQTYPELKKTMKNIKKLHPAAIFCLVFKYGMQYALKIKRDKEMLGSTWDSLQK